jgi:PAS domain S-box-containing protein
MSGESLHSDVQAPSEAVHPLPPVPESVGEARRLVTVRLQALEVSDTLVDTARLLVSELVTNAVLHARTEIGLRVEVRSAVLRVEVSDRSVRVPSPRHYAPTAATGRGMALVEALAHQFGMQLTDTGKIVWFALALNRSAPQSGLVHQDAAPATHHVAPDGSTFPVHLVRVPTALYGAFAQQAEGLLREYLLATYVDEVDAATTARLGIAAEALGWITDAVGSAFEEQPPAGRHVDVALLLPATAMTAFPVLQAVLADAVTMADSGALLAPPSQPEIVALGEWFCGQVVDQCLGQPGLAWQPLHDGRPPARPRPDWDSAVLLSARTAMVAADEANRILAINSQLTDLLGWSTDDLVGHRIVTLIPQDLREHHIAGFTRYLTTGEAHLLDQPVSVPALHRDGHQVAITIVVREHTLASGGRVFIAELSLTEPV